MKLMHLAATVVLVGATTVACGGSPSNASVEDFCSAFEDVVAASAEVDTEQPEGEVGGIKDAVADFADTGTPEDISDDARAGFELLTERFADLGDDATVADVEKSDEEITDEEQDQLDALESFVEKNCEDASAE